MLELRSVHLNNESLVGLVDSVYIKKWDGDDWIDRIFDAFELNKVLSAVLGIIEGLVDELEMGTVDGKIHIDVYITVVLD